MSFLLMVFLTLVCLYERYPAPWWPLTPGESALLTLASVAVVGLHAFWVSRRVSWPLARDASLRDRLLTGYERGRFLHQFVQYGVYSFALVGLGWGWAVRECWLWGDQALPGLEILTLAPFLAGQLLTWLCFYDADRAAHRAAHQLLESDAFAQTWLESRHLAPTGFGSRGAYVWFQARQKLALVFIPVLLLIFQKEMVRLCPAVWLAWQGVMNAVAIVLLSGVFICMPLLMRWVLGLRPLPPGPLRDRLLATSHRLGFRCSDILLWNTRSGMANAMVIGLVPWLRYVVFTDRLIEEFPEDEIEAVFGHEIGHIRHQHMLFYLIFLMTSMVVMYHLADFYLLPLLRMGSRALADWQSWIPSLEEYFVASSDLALFPVVAVILLYIFVVFGYVSRRCERQADVYGCRAVSCVDPNCEGHGPETPMVAAGRGLCATGIRTFIRALEKVALVNGISRDRPGFLQSWQHSTIAQRVAFLRGMELDPKLEPTFQGRLRWVKTGLLSGIFFALTVLVLLHGWRW